MPGTGRRTVRISEAFVTDESRGVVRILGRRMGFSPEGIKDVIVRYRTIMDRYREEINALNVFPVPDGDTGTNMALTMGSVVEALEQANSMTEVADAISRGSMMGARGNSGVILAQILRAMASVFKTTQEVGSNEMVAALKEASDAAYRAVQRPVEGTILTVLREAALAAQNADGCELAELADLIHDEAVASLARTPELLPVLRQAGVVDAGGAGLLLLFGAIREACNGRPAQLPPEMIKTAADLGPPEVADLQYEVMFFLESDEARVTDFRETWAEIGDSIVVVGGEGTWNCHIHTDDIGAAIEAGVERGRPFDIRVTDLKEQAGDHGAHGAFVPLEAVQTAPIGVVAVSAGTGLVDVFRQLGCQGVVVGGQTMNPSTEDLLAIVDAARADVIVVLPNNKNIVPVAEQLDSLTTKTVLVVPTRSVPQGIAAMFGYDLVSDDIGGMLEDMAAAASSIVDGEITQAVRDAMVDYGFVRKGDWMGIADGAILVADPDQEATLRGLVAAILPLGAELLTVYTGRGAPAATTKALVAWMGELYPFLSVKVVEGGQPLYPYLVSIE